MKSCCSLATWCAGMLLALALLPAPLPAQEPAAQRQKAAPQTQSAVPQTYQLDIRNVLAYQVVSTTRAGTLPPTTAKYREMVVFDIDGDENLVVYIGSPNLKALAAAAPPAAAAARVMDKRPAEHRPGSAAAQTEHKPAGAEEPEKVQLTWTRHVLGKTFTRNAEGTISFRPPQGETMPYPVLPLPPAELKDKERFELTVPDLALGEGKTVAVVGTCKVSAEGKTTVDCHMEPKAVPGGMPELAVVGYDIPAGATGVSAIRMSRRLASEPAAQPGREGGDAAAMGRPHGERGERAARPAGPQAQPMTSVLVQLLSSKPVPDDLRKGLISTIGNASHGEESEAPAGESGDKSKPVTGNLFESVDQIGSQVKEKSEAAGK